MGRLLLAFAATATIPPCTALPDQGGEAESVESIFAKTSNGYVRLLRADGTFQPEAYKFGKGEFWGGDFVDASIDRMSVDDVARAIAPALASQRYVPAKDPDPAQLFIVINWGTTVAPEHRSMDPAYERVEAQQMSAHTSPGPAASRVAGDMGAMNGVTDGLQGAEINGSGNSWNMGGADSKTAIAQTRSTGDPNRDTGSDGTLQAENQMWAQISLANAQMLGYERFSDAELQRYRYFVVLLAYDARTISQKKPKLLWEARLSITQHRNLFDKKLSAIANNASSYFGQNSNGLVRKLVPAGFVRIGEIRSLEFPVEADAAALADDGVHVAYLRRQGSESGLAIVDLDRPDGSSFVRIPGGETPARIGWGDSAHVLVAFVSSGPLAFDANAKAWSAATAELAAGHGTIVHQDGMQARAEGKFPHRTVEILGSDKAGKRYLLAVSGPKGAPRYYILDNQADIVVDVGRSSRAP